MKPSFSYPTHSGRTNPATHPGKHPARLYCLPAVLLALVMMICAAGPATTFAQSVIYVNDDAAGANNGSSWADAYKSLQDALDAAGSGDQIWVAEGVYTPVTPADPSNVTEGEREATFQLVNGVKIYGGFAGDANEDELSDRNVEANLTILSGDIDGNDNTFDPEMNNDGDPDTPTQTDHIVGDNSYHVVTAGDGITLTTRLDGFTITGGSADSGDGTINNFGGGMFNNFDGSTTLTGVTFSGNRAATRGGGMYNRGSPTLTGVTFSGNRAATRGGGMNNRGGSPTLTNVTFSGNEAGIGGGMFNNFDGSTTLTNVILWGNQSNSIGGVTPDNITYSLVQGLAPDGEGNLDGTDPANNPQFAEQPDPADAPTTAGDLRLLPGSPAINAGSNQAYIDAGGDPDNDTDLAGNPRRQYGTIDMGAYEFQGEPETPITLTMDEGWRMLSSPIYGLTYSQMLEPLWTQGVPGTDHEGDESTFPNVYTWNTGYTGDCIEEYNNNQDCNGWQVPSSTDFGDPIPPGTGFLVYVFADDDYDGDPEGFEKNLTLTGANHSGEISPPMNTIPEGWTLVGNPYRQPVAFDALEKTNLTDIAYIYDPNAMGINPPGPVNGNGGAWRTTVDGTYGDITNGVIAPGQGFFVQNSGSAGSLTFTEESTTGGGEFYGKQAEPRDYVRLELNGEALTNSTWIRFSENGSTGRTKGEALELQPLSADYAMLSARKADGTLMDIAHYPLKTQELEIPLAVEATRSGTFTITATDLDLPAGMKLYLYDKKTSESMLITDTSFEYSFTVDAQTIPPYQGGTEGGVPLAQNATPQQILAAGAIGPSKAKTIGENRFVITTTAGAPAGELPTEVALGQNYPNPFNPATVISYQLPQQSQVRLDVYDMLGRNVATLVDGQVAAGRHQVNFNAGNLSSGVYLYRLQANGTNGASQIFTKKLTLIK